MAAEPIAAEVLIAASPERVFEYLTQPEAIVRWMGEYALLDPTPGGRFELNVKGTPIRGRYLELDPPHRLLISWGYAGSEHLPPGASTVEVQLTAEENGTRVVLEHRGLPEAETQNHETGWTHYLARLRAVTADGQAGPDPGCPRPPAPEPVKPGGTICDRTLPLPRGDEYPRGSHRRPAMRGQEGSGGHG